MSSSFQKEYDSVRRGSKMDAWTDFSACNSLVFTSQEKRLISRDKVDLKSPELEKANSFTLSSHTWNMKHQMKI